MDKKKLIISFLSLILSLLLFIFATYAWFTLSTNVSNSPINLTVDPGIIKSYDARIYTYDNIYRTSSADPTIDRYFSGGWIDAVHIDPDDIDALESAQGTNYVDTDFWGIVMKPYDPLITENNLVNNIIIGIHLTYEVESTTNVSLTAIANESIGYESRDAFGVAQGDPEELYLSEVVNVQMLPAQSTDVYDFGIDSNNLYFTLTTSSLFQDIISYEPYNFYDGTTYPVPIEFDFDTNDGQNDIDNYQLTGSGDLYIYLNISYNPGKVSEALSGLLSGTFGEIELYRFFQDIQLIIQKEV